MTNSVKYETDLIPFNTSNLPEGQYLVFAPHPDDETFGMGGTIALATRNGVEVSLVVVTDGAKGGDITTRKDELNKAAAILGIKKIIFMDYVDRETHDSCNLEKKMLEIIKKMKPDNIFSPSLFEYHPDHRNIAKILLKYFKRGLYKSHLWFYEITRLAEANRLIDITPTIDIKRKAIRCYQSQLCQRDYESVSLAINKARVFTLTEDVKYAEAFWETKNKDEISLIKSKIEIYLEGI